LKDVRDRAVALIWSVRKWRQRLRLPVILSISAKFKEMMMKTLMLLLAVFVLAGCNMMEGLGKDIQKGGAKLEKAAER
jgi:predicted small secreted protein